MKVPYVSITNAIQDWTQDAGIGHKEINPTLITKWAVDCVKWCSTDQQLKHRVTVLSVENSRARLPDDFKMLAQAASNVHYEEPCNCNEVPKPDCCGKKSTPNRSKLPKTRREDIVQWIQGTSSADGCKLEVNLICPKCSSSKCTCNNPVVEVDVDRIWEMAHPEIYYSNFITARIGRFGNGPLESAYNPKFRLMRYSTNDYFKMRHLVTDCPNVNCDSCHKEFMLDLPYIEVDFGEGEILLSYLGTPLDGDGEMMIPDHPDIHAAIFWHLESKVLWIEYRSSIRDNSTRSGNILQAHKVAEQNRETHIGLAKSVLEIPENHQFKNYLESSSWLKRTPEWSSDYVGKRTPNRGENYGDILDGNRR